LTGKEAMGVAQYFRQALLKFLTVIGQALLTLLTFIFGLWCFYLFYDKTPLAEFAFIGNACAWSWLAAAASLMLMTPFYHLDKRYTAAMDIAPANSKRRLGDRIISSCFFVFAVCAILSLIAFGISVSGFLLAKSFVVIRPLF